MIKSDSLLQKCLKITQKGSKNAKNDFFKNQKKYFLDEWI